MILGFIIANGGLGCTAVQFRKFATEGNLKVGQSARGPLDDEGQMLTHGVLLQSSTARKFVTVQSRS